MAARLIGLGWTEELPLDQIPNHKNLEDAYTDLAWDPGAKHSCRGRPASPASPTNPKLTGRELTSANDLFDPAFKGKVGMLTEMRDSVGLTMFAQGNDPAEAEMDEVQRRARQDREGRRTTARS